MWAYRPQAGSWVNTQVFEGDDTLAGDFFAFEMDLDGSTLVVSAYQEDSQGTNAGAVYVFEFVGGSWTQSQKLGMGSLLAFERTAGTWAFAQRLRASKVGNEASFGWSVDAFGERLLVGAPAPTAPRVATSTCGPAASTSPTTMAPAGSRCSSA